MSQLALDSRRQPSLDPGRAAPLLHKWFARRRPDAIRKVLDGLDDLGERRSLRILDPFAGSGMILLECLTRGHDVFGVDINPVAWLIARQTLTPPDVEQVEYAFQTIDDAVGPRIRRFFATTTPDNIPAEMVTGFYVRVVSAPDGNDIELHHNYLIARNRKQDWAVYYCPACGNIFYTTCLDIIVCTQCLHEYDWRRGTVLRGKVKVGAEEFTLAELYAGETSEPQFKLIGVESYSAETGRLFHRPSEKDYQNIDTARAQSLNHDIAAELRSTLIPTARRDPRPISHGFRTYGQLFGPRQLLSLSLIAETIRGLKEQEQRFAMALALSDAAGSNNLMCRYAADWLKLTPAFGLHGFDVVTRPVEGNVWGAARGRGSFSNCVAKSIRAYATIESTVSKAEDAREMGATRDVRCAPAQALSTFGWNKVDAIVTDPPYFDNLDYGELGDFYYQWLRISLSGAVPFDRSYSLDSSDLARIAALDKDPQLFSNELADILGQSIDHLEVDGVVAFSYHHAKAQAWECLADALKNASLVPYRLRFVRSELNNGFHSSRGNIKVDSIFYCRKRTSLAVLSSDALMGDALDDLSAMEGLKPVDEVSAAYAIATALAALSPSSDFADLLDSVKRVGRWNC